MAHITIDISMHITEGMFAYPRSPRFLSSGPLSFIEGDVREYCYELRPCTQTGTHIQGPHYFLRDGRKIHQFPLSAFEGECRVLDIDPSETVTEERVRAQLTSEDISSKIVLFRSGRMDEWLARLEASRSSGEAGSDKGLISELLKCKPGLSPDGARFLVSKGPKMLGIDSVGFEPPGSHSFEVNRYLCEHELLLLECLVNLDKVPRKGAWLEAFPLPIVGVEGTPCRALVRMPIRPG